MKLVAHVQQALILLVFHAKDLYFCSKVHAFQVVDKDFIKVLVLKLVTILANNVQLDAVSAIIQTLPIVQAVFQDTFIWNQI